MLLDVASLVDTVAVEPDFGARAMFVLGQRLPMAAFFVRGRPAGGRPIETCADLVRARYGGEPDSRFVMEHRALLRRLGRDDPDLLVEMGYEELFEALAAGRIDVAPDYAGILTRYQRTAGAGVIGLLRYRDCGVTAYGTAFVASARGLAERRAEIGAFLEAAAAAYRRMRADPERVLEEAGRALPGLDPEYALREWREEEEPVIFGYGELGRSDPAVWAETASWRRDVASLPRVPAPAQLFDALRDEG